MIEWIVTSCILILIIILLRAVLKGKLNLRLQYALWGLVLIRLLVPVTFGHTGISVTNLTAAAPVQNTVQIIDDITEISIPSQSFEDAYHEVVQEYVNQGVDVSVLQGSELEALDYEAFERMKSPWTVQDILITIWGIGTGLVALWLLISNLHFGAKLRHSRKAMVVKECTQPVYVTAAVETPCLFGLFRPAIYVTPDATEDPAQLRHTLQHELTHFRHGDHIWAILRGICLALHWYNPLVWWAASLSRRDAELACDEGTLKRLGEDQRAAYGRTLIAMTCQKHGSLLLTATTMTGSKHSIKERITLIAKKPKMAIYTLVAVLLIATLAVGCTFTGANEPKETPPNDPTPDATDSLTHEDVILYNCDGLTIAIPKDYKDKLIVKLGEGKPLISVYEKASIDAAAEHGITDDSLGWIFSLVRCDQADMERYFSEDHSGVQVFAKDEDWHYAYVTPTDSTYFPHESTGAGEEEWKLLNEQIGPSIRDDFIARNDLSTVAIKDSVLYDFDGLTVAIPGEYHDKLIVKTGGDHGKLFTFYEKASWDAGKKDGYENAGFLFSLRQVDQAYLEEYLENKYSGELLFATNKDGYYFYSFPTDVTFYPGEGENWDIAREAYTALQDGLWAFIRDDFISQNGLSAVTDADMDYPGSPTAAQSLLTTFAAAQTPATLELAFVTEQGRTVAGKYNAWGVLNDTHCSLAFSQANFSPCYPRSMTGTQITLSPTDESWSASFWQNSGYVELSTADGTNSFLAEPTVEDYFYPNLGAIMRLWYDEAEWAGIGDYYSDPELVVIPDRGQDYLSAAKEYSQAVKETHLAVTTGSKSRYTYVSCSVEDAPDATEHLRAQGEIGENTYCYYLTTVFVPENERARDYSMAGNTGNYSGSDPTVPEDALENFLCAFITLEEDGWHGRIVGTGW